MADSAIWVKVFPSTGSGDEGGPGWDVLTAVQSGVDVQLSWPAAGGTPTSYEISTNGIIQDVGNVLTYLKTGLTLGVEYTFKVRAVAAGLTGGWSSEKKVTPQYNAATGGVETTITNYNGTGQTWKVHTFATAGNSSLVVTRGGMPSKVFLIGGGGGAGANYRNEGCNGGGAGLVYQSDTEVLPVATLPVTVGGGGRGSDSYPDGGANRGQSAEGGTTTFNGRTGTRGGLGGGYEYQRTLNGGYSNGIGGGNNGGGATANGTDASRTPITSNISGANVNYGLGGANGAGGAALPGDGGGAITQAGIAGTVIVAYRIA